MKATYKTFSYDEYFLKVRDFLSKTHGHYQGSVNWRIERWEYAFHFVAPFLANWRQQPPLRESVDEANRLLESLTGIWESPSGDVVGVVNIEHPDRTHPGFGEWFIQRHPDYLCLLPKMLNFAEENLVDHNLNRLFIYIEDDDQPLQELLGDRGFRAFPEDTLIESAFDLTTQTLPATPDLPEQFRIQSMADDNDLSKRCKAFGCGFNHPDPLEWPSQISYEMLQQAPDYQKHHDIVVVAPDGEFASFCLIWIDLPNRLASLEPVGSQPKYRKMGLAREAIFEAMRRAAAQGVEQVIVGSSQVFYQKIGFKPLKPKVRYQKNYS